MCRLEIAMLWNEIKTNVTQTHFKNLIYTYSRSLGRIEDYCTQMDDGAIQGEDETKKR